MKLIRWLTAAVLLPGLILSKSLAQSGPPPFPQEMDLFTAYLFQDTNWLSIWGDSPLSGTNIDLVSTWDGNGLQVDSTNAAWLSYTFESQGYPNLDLTNGTIRFWFVPNWISTNLGGDGPGVWGRLIDVGQWTTNASYGWVSLFVDPTGCNIFFSAQSNDGSETNYLYAPIQWDGSTWHMIELTYSPSNTALYLDGSLATNGPGITILPPSEALSNGFYIGSDGTGEQQSHGQFDEFYIFGNQQTNTLDISNEFAAINPFANPPLYVGFFGDDDPTPPGGSSGGGGTNGGIVGTGFSGYGSNVFWLQILPPGTNIYNADSNSLTFVLHATIADVDYQIQCTTNIQTSNTIWTLVGDVLGSEATNFTTITALKSNLPTLYFRAFASTLDSDGSGLPDWWQQANFGSLGTDPYADPAGDGYDNLYKYQNNMSPYTYYTPRAPSPFVAALNTNGNIVVSWSPAANLPDNGAGEVTGYTLQIQSLDYTDNYFTTNYINLGTNQFSFQTNIDVLTRFFMDFPYDLTRFPPPNGYGPPALFSLRINYANGTSLWTPLSPPFDAACVVDAQTVRGSGGNFYLAVSSIPTNVTAIRVMTGGSGLSFPLNNYGYNFIASEVFGPNFGDGATNWPEAYFDVPASNIVNGLYQIPPSRAGLFGCYSIVTMGVGVNGSLGTPTLASPTYEDNYDVTWGSGSHNLTIPFLDGRTNIAQNINMLLRGAGTANPFNLGLAYIDIGGNADVNCNLSQPTNYVWNGYSFIGSGYYPWDGFNFLPNFGYFSQRNEFEPFEESSFYTNLIFHSGLFNPDGTFTGVVNVDDFLGIQVVLFNSNTVFDAYDYVTNNPSLPLGALPPPTLDDTTENWILAAEDPDLSVFYNYGTFTGNSDGSLTLNSNARNLYGLHYQGIKYLDANTNWSVAGSGGTFSIGPNNSAYFQDVDSPALSTVDYYFARPQIDPVPGESGFSTTNQTPPLFAPFGKPLLLTAWAKQSLLNGNYGVYAFPQQYFDKAFLADTNGNPTTNQTGILSEYGDFLPTQTGQVILTTKPDGATHNTGQCSINIIKLQLDVNHDGTMDTSFSGPDNTSVNHPFTFWANNDYDRLEFDADDNTNYEDSVLVAGCPYTPNQDTKDNNYRDASGRRVIPTKRDLQDFTRLWLAGITTNLLTNLPSGSTITLSWGDVGSPNTNNPVIDLFAAAEANGGIGYLTNETVASQQTNIALCPYIGRLGPGSSIQLNASTFSNHWAGNYFIWCGAAYGSGALTLTIADASSNVLAQTVAYIQIVDIKQMYERWTVGDAPTIVPTTNAIPAVEDLPPFTQAFQYPYDPATDANTPYILFVHGWNMTRNDKDRFAESAFKRLYWQGYQGRFGLFRWPTDNGFKGTLSQLFSDSTQKDNYDRSEYQAWQSAAGLRNKLNDLNAKYPGHVYMLAHSMGNVVAGEALRLSGSSQVVNTYVASQGAVSAHTYDTNVPNYSFSYPPFSSSADTPNIYGGWFAGNNGNGAGRVINFYNTNDYALARGHWQLDQLFKPDQAVLESGVNWYYNYSGSTNDPPPWNNFYKQNSDGSTVIGFNIVTSLNNRYEVMAFDAQSYTTALGATPGVGHIAANVNITTLWPSPDPLGNNYGSHFYHSAEFRGDTAPEWNYWHLLLTSPTTGFNISTP